MAFAPREARVGAAGARRALLITKSVTRGRCAGDGSRLPTGAAHDGVVADPSRGTGLRWRGPTGSRPTAGALTAGALTTSALTTSALTTSALTTGALTAGAQTAGALTPAVTALTSRVGFVGERSITSHEGDGDDNQCARRGERPDETLSHGVPPSLDLVENRIFCERTAAPCRKHPNISSLAAPIFAPPRGLRTVNCQAGG
jgi:hypothetical protein